MTIALLRFPYLVYDKILKELNSYERCLLATISKRTRWIVKRSFGKHKFELEITDIKLYYIMRDDRESIFINLNDSYRWFSEFNVLKRVLIPLKDLGMDSKKALKKYYDLDVFATKVTQFLINTLPNLTILMDFEKCEGSARSVTDVIRKSNLQIDHLSVTCSNHKKLRDVLSNCGTLKTLHIDGLLQDQTLILPYLQCEEVYFDGTCCEGQIVNVFMNCQRFISSYFVPPLSTTGLMRIFEAWKNNSRLDYLELKFHSGTYQNIMKEIQGEPKKFKLGDRAHNCHLIRQLNGKEAVIYILFEDAEVITLRTDFELVVS